MKHDVTWDENYIEELKKDFDEDVIFLRFSHNWREEKKYDHINKLLTKAEKSMEEMKEKEIEKMQQEIDGIHREIL